MNRKLPGINRMAAAALTALFAFISLGSAWAQPREITGVVTSATDGETIVGASVVAVGSNVGTSTDGNGAYSLRLPEGTVSIEISVIGYESQVIQVGSQAVINVVLKESVSFLDEVVVIGYGMQKKALTTGANLNVKGEELAKRSSSNPLQALQGQTPGMQITSTSGQPGEGMKVTIRGLGTTGNASPLYIVDGIPSDITKVNPGDIESIDVLKDAASAAIYGAQAANGVVIVTTKSGKAGTEQVYYDGYYGVQNVYRYPNMLNSQEYQVIMNEQSLNSGSAAIDWSQYNTTADTDWVRQMFRQNAPVQNHTVGVTGGGEKAVYALSFNYSGQDGLAGSHEKSSYESYKFRTNTEFKLFDNLLKVGEHFNFAYNNKAGISVGNQYNNSLRSAYNTSPLSPVYGHNEYGWGDANGEWNDSSIYENGWFNNDGNPYASMMLGRSATTSQNVIGDIYAELNPIEGLKIRSTFGISYYASAGHGISFPAKWNAYGTSPSVASDYYPTANQNSSNGLSLSWINTAAYDFTVAEDHNISVMAGTEWDRSNGTWMNSSNKMSVEQFMDYDHAWLQNGSANRNYWSQPGGGINDEEKTMSVFSRLGYNYKERYMFNATLRADGSSKFAASHRWGFFPSVSAGWIMTNEEWLKDSEAIDFLKLRASWGQVGNKNITGFAYTAPIATSYHTYNFGTGLGTEAEQNGAVQSRLANSDITWETSEQLDLGVDARAFSSRMEVNLDFYRKTTRDWLITAPIVYTAGTDAPYINGGDVINGGVELAVKWQDHIGDFNYYVNANGSYNRNVVGNIPNTDGIIHGNANELFDNAKEFYRAENGHAIGYWWGLQTDGIFQNQAEIDEWVAAGNGTLQSNPQPGDARFIDRNKDGIISDLDKVDLGNGMPDFSYGFSLGFDYKGLDFNVTAYGVAGNEIVQSYRNYANQYANYTTAVLNRWTGEGTSTKVPRVTNTNVNYAEFSDLFLQKGDYLRISNITVGYDLSKVLKFDWLSQMRFYVSVQNALTFTKYDGMDPEIGYGTSDWCSGIDLGYYPHPRTVLVGLNLKF